MEPFTKQIRVNLQIGPAEVSLGSLANEDSLANQFIFDVRNGETIVTFSNDDNVECRVVRRDGATVLISAKPISTTASLIYVGSEYAGLDENGKPYVNLPDEAYAVTGNVLISVSVTNGTKRTTLAMINGVVRYTTTGLYMNPEDAAITIQDLIDMMSDFEPIAIRAENAAGAARSSAESAAASAEEAAETVQEAISDIQTEGASQVSAITAKGEEVLESIPEDYSELSEEVADLKSAIITDVQVNGGSVVANGVANVPLADTNGTPGAVKIVAGNGIGLSGQGNLSISPAISAAIKNGINGSTPIVPALQHESVFYGLAKAAGDSTQSSSSNAVGAYTDAAIQAIQSMLGVSSLNGDIADLKSALDENLMGYVETVYPTNWFNANGLMSGILKVDGTITEDSTRKYSDYFIPVVPGNTVRLTRGDYFNSMYLTKVTAYDAGKNVLSAKGLNSANYTYTIPDGVAYIKFTMAASNTSYLPMLTVSGAKPTSYVAYFDPYNVLTKNFLTADADAIMQLLTNGTFSTKNLANRYGCALPQTRIYQTLGLPEKWYKSSMVTPNNTSIIVGAGGSYTEKDNTGITFTNTTAVSSANGYSWAWYDVFLATIKTSNGSAGLGWSRRFMAENLSDCSALIIGDSTVDHDTMTATLLSHFAEQGHTITLLGTLGDGSGPNKNEGRAGWSAQDYLTDRQYQGVTNPFYNPSTQTFDFAYYMQNQGYTTPDFVVLQLGINDLYNYGEANIAPTWSAMETIIDSILAYSDSIKVILNLPTTPNANQSQHSACEFLYRNRVIRYNEYAMAQSLAKYGTAKVRCSYCHLILDPETEIRDNVHPTVSGYQKMALEVVNQINCWQAGV